MKIANVSLPNGMVVSCRQKHEVPIVNLEIQGYLANGLRLKPGDTVFDVGAHVGLFTLAAYEHCQRNLKVYAFEPAQATFELLCLNLDRYDQKQQLKAFPFGLSSSCEEVSFAYYPRATSLSTAYPNEEADLKIVKEATLNNIIYLDEAPLALRCLRWLPSFLLSLILHYPLKRTLYLKTVTCQMQTLSQFLRDHRIGRIDLLKVDAEKAELEIFRGIKAQDWPKIQQVVVDVHDLDQRLEAMTALLQQYGLRKIVVGQPPTLKNSEIFTVHAMRR
ncbi:MAG: FkbM family methyltransferase [Syntrophobacterales bacterium]